MFVQILVRIEGPTVTPTEVSRRYLQTQRWDHFVDLFDEMVETCGISRGEVAFTGRFRLVINPALTLVLDRTKQIIVQHARLIRRYVNH